MHGMEVTEKHVVRHNLAKLMENSGEQKFSLYQFCRYKLRVEEMEKDTNKLRTKVFTRKEVQKNDTEIMKIRQNK
jgi:hypothetical protein